MKSSVIRLKNTYFNKDLDYQVQVFHILTFIGIIAGAGTAVMVLAMEHSTANVIIDFSLSALSLILLIAAERKKAYHLCGWLMIIVAFFVLIPATFFYCGGYRSGANFTFLIAFVFTESLLERHERTVAIALEFVIYTACYLVVYIRPETATILADESEYFLATVTNCAVSGIIIILVLFVRTRIFRSHRTQVQELLYELMARNKSLEQFDRMKSDFLSMVAHEINTPMTTIIASSRDTLDLLSETPLDTEEIVENQRRIEKKVRLIDAIITDLMDTAAIENGRLSLHRQNVSLSEVLKVACDAHFKQPDMHNNRILFDFQQGLPHISIDPIRIEQVMMNLLSNAVIHTYNGTISVILKQDGAAQVVSVTDTGEGMDSEMAQLAFEQFRSSKEDYWRHGIGLYICSSIISAHGGEIWIDSEKGRGTSVSFSLNEVQETVDRSDSAAT